MRKSLATLALLIALSTTSCMTGPFRLSRTWDDMWNQNFTENAWLDGAILGTIIPVYPLVGWVMTLGDVIVVNTYHFWAKDAWDNRGTGFNHKSLSGASKSVTGWGFD